MEKPPLEKVIEKLEKLDINEWKYEYHIGGMHFVVRTNGLIFYLSCDSKNHLRIVSDYRNKELSYSPKNQPEKDMLKKFYEKIVKSYEEIREKELQERLDSFLSE